MSMNTRRYSAQVLASNPTFGNAATTHTARTTLTPTPTQYSPEHCHGWHGGDGAGHRRLLRQCSQQAATAEPLHVLSRVAAMATHTTCNNNNHNRTTPTQACTAPKRNAATTGHTASNCRSSSTLGVPCHVHETTPTHFHPSPTTLTPGTPIETETVARWRATMSCTVRLTRAGSRRPTGRQARLWSLAATHHRRSHSLAASALATWCANHQTARLEQHIKGNTTVCVSGGV